MTNADGAMLLSIGRWLIRSWQAEDEEAIVRYANNRSVSIHLRDSFPYPYTRADAQAWLRSVRRRQPETMFAIASQQEAIGGIGLHIQPDVYRISAELGYWLGEPFWGQGIATEAVRAVTEWGFSHLGLARIYAGVFDGNPASARVLEKAGFMLEGRMRSAVIKEGRILDQFLYARVRT